MSDFDKIDLHSDAGYEPFSMFGGSGGEAKFMVNDDVNKKYVGFFRNDQPLGEDNEWHLDIEEYLYVIEGEIQIDFLDTGKTEVVGAGEFGYLPYGSRIHLTLTKLPYSESFVMQAPRA